MRKGDRLRLTENHKATTTLGRVRPLPAGWQFRVVRTDAEFVTAADGSGDAYLIPLALVGTVVVPDDADDRTHDGDHSDGGPVAKQKLGKRRNAVQVQEAA